MKAGGTSVLVASTTAFFGEKLDFQVENRWFLSCAISKSIFTLYQTQV